VVHYLVDPAELHHLRGRQPALADLSCGSDLKLRIGPAIVHPSAAAGLENTATT